MNIGGAIDALRRGLRVQRKGWNGKGMYLFLVPGSEIKVSEGRPLADTFDIGTAISIQPHIDMMTAQGSIVPWLASQTDILAEDWYVDLRDDDATTT